MLAQSREEEWEFRASRVPQAKFVHFRRRRDGQGAGRLILRANRALRRQVFPLEDAKGSRVSEETLDGGISGLGLSALVSEMAGGKGAGDVDVDDGDGDGRGKN